MKQRIALLVSAVLLMNGVAANAANLAVFGQNNIGDFYSSIAGGSHTITYVNDSQLATVGFLDGFDAFIYTRDGYSFGSGLSVDAAANVKSYVTGNVVLFNGDFQDDIGVANTNLLFSNALAFVLGGAGKGYLGEYRGAFAAYASNDDGNNPIGLINGRSGVSGYAEGGSNLDINRTSYGDVHSITAGVTFPYDPAAVEYGAQLSGENPAVVLARFANGNAAIIAGGVDQISAPVPEADTYAMLLVGLGLLGAVVRRRNRIA